MAGWVHRLSNVDVEERVADCANCGRVDIRVQFLPHRTKVRCMGATRDEWARRYGDNRPGRVSPHHGLTRSERTQIILEARACAICGVGLDTSKATHIDHDHATGKVRGALCRSCNWGLGHFKDSVTSLKKAIEYLEA